MNRGGVTGFLVERCLPVYPVLLTLWVCAAESLTSVIVDSGPWRPSAHTAIKVVTLLAAGAFLRMADDQKDLDYDRRHHPTRPLVRGSVTVGRLRAAMIPAAAAALATAAALSPWSLALMAAVLVYGLALWRAEAVAPLLRDNALANLAAACPVQFLITGFAMTGVPGLGDAPGRRLALVPVVFTCALLHAEIARKTDRHPGPASADRHSYSALMGPTASAGIACGFGIIAVGAELLASTPWNQARPLGWLPLATVALPLLAWWRFRRTAGPDFPRVLPTVFVLALLLSVVAQGLDTGLEQR